MKTTSIAAAFAAAAIAAAGAITAFSAPNAIADDHNAVNTTHLGSQAELVDGNVVQGWTVTGLKVSTDTIPYQPHGTLWEATATDHAIQGSAIPIVSNFNARARDGQTYRALFGVATAQGVNPATLAQGQQTSGKVYFDVTGSAPDSVVYATNATDLIVWVTPPPAASTGGGAAASGTRTYQAPATEATSTETSTTETPAAPADAEATTPAPTTVPAEAGRQGTPLPEGTAETAAVPAGSQGTPLPEGEPGLTPAGVQEAPAAAAVPSAEAVPPAEGAAPAPAAVEGTLPGDEARIDGGSQGTPLPAGAAPVTTPVIAPPA
ncbi:MPT63 family protein [Mycolicibacterium frederiksbergense]|uniref:MPT63 family protein n=1 Tax=Mycolicibacterium frederiksbergense TaxID=117567 RepID=UPI00265C69AB|nr:MPT63 family protein [Mycolicibacterium frederiksbergense]MDO0975139.1 MPT63 family protein [Mycolicibacterium frederiksbergense]